MSQSLVVQLHGQLRGQLYYFLSYLVRIIHILLLKCWPQKLMQETHVQLALFGFVDFCPFRCADFDVASHLLTEVGHVDTAAFRVTEERTAVVRRRHDVRNQERWDSCCIMDRNDVFHCEHA